MSGNVLPTFVWSGSRSHGHFTQPTTTPPPSLKQEQGCQRSADAADPGRRPETLTETTAAVLMLMMMMATTTTTSTMTAGRQRQGNPVRATPDEVDGRGESQQAFLLCQHPTCVNIQHSLCTTMYAHMQLQLMSTFKLYQHPTSSSTFNLK